MVAVRQRPHLAAFLERVAQLFEVVIFTASQKVRFRPSGGRGACRSCAAPDKPRHGPSAEACCASPGCHPLAEGTESSRRLCAAGCPESGAELDKWISVRNAALC